MGSFLCGFAYVAGLDVLTLIRFRSMTPSEAQLIGSEKLSAIDTAHRLVGGITNNKHHHQYQACKRVVGDDTKRRHYELYPQKSFFSCFEKQHSIL